LDTRVSRFRRGGRAGGVCPGAETAARKGIRCRAPRPPSGTRRWRRVADPAPDPDEFRETAQLGRDAFVAHLRTADPTDTGIADMCPTAWPSAPRLRRPAPGSPAPALPV